MATLLGRERLPRNARRNTSTFRLPSAFNRGHVRIAIAFDGVPRNYIGQHSKLFCVKLDRCGGNILLKVLNALGPRDRNHVHPLREHPGQSQLPGSNAPFMGQPLNLAN